MAGSKPKGKTETKTHTIHRVVEKGETADKRSYTVHEVTTVTISGPNLPDFDFGHDSDAPCIPCKHNLHNDTAQLSELRQPLILPATDKDCSKVNALLKFCKEQSKEFDIVDRPGFMEVIIQRCLQAMGVKSSVLIGYRDVNGPVSQSHIWLDINNHHVDINKLNKEKYLYLQKNYPNCYTPAVCFEAAKPRYPNPTCEFLKQRRIEFMQQYPDQALALCLNHEHSYNFYFAIIRYMFTTHNVSIQGISPKVRYQCWKCERFPKGGMGYLSNIIDEDLEKDDSDDETAPTSNTAGWKFLQCPKCMVANYCSRKCQEVDWQVKHEMNCMSKGVSYLHDSFD